MTGSFGAETGVTLPDWQGEEAEREGYRDTSLESASCRFYIAPSAIFAVRPVDHCTLPHVESFGTRTPFVEHRPKSGNHCGDERGTDALSESNPSLVGLRILIALLLNRE